MEIYGLDERLAVEKVGNKAAFLSLMKNNGFNVPMGIVLGNEVFNETILANSNKAKVDELLKALSKDNKEETSKNIQKLYLGLTLSDKVKSAINERINSEKKYAVRSSGMMEDLDGYSFAGQYFFLFAELYHHLSLIMTSKTANKILFSKAMQNLKIMPLSLTENLMLKFLTAEIFTLPKKD